MVPASDKHYPYNDSQFEEFYKGVWKSSNFLQPWELLGGHCIAEFMMCNETLINNFQQVTTDNERKRNTLLDMLFIESSLDSGTRKACNLFKEKLDIHKPHETL